MTKPRKQLIAIENTPYYHVTSRCVRRAFLSGTQDGKSYEHRRQWLVERIRLLSSSLAIVVVGYRHLQLCGDEQSLPHCLKTEPRTARPLDRR
jgi:hypothetical protein